MDDFVHEVNARPGITHNYLREHNYNIWFTLISPSREDERATLDDITARTGIPILNLPATRLFKIRVDAGLRPVPDTEGRPQGLPFFV